MYTVIRHYTGPANLADELKARSKDIETLISGVPGFINYYLIKTGNGAVTVTVCDDRAGCDESTKRAASFIRENLKNLEIPAPQIITGELAFKTSSKTSV